jgi:hypothetical protein
MILSIPTFYLLIKCREIRSLAWCLAEEACLFVLASEENGKRGKKTKPTVDLC